MVWKEIEQNMKRKHWMRNAIKIPFWKLKLKLCCVQLKNKSSEQTMSNTRLIKLLIHQSAEVWKEKQSDSIVSQCENLERKVYKRKHDNVTRIVNWKLCGKYNLERDDKWCVHIPESAIENKEVNILWDVMKQCDKNVEGRKQVIVAVNKEERSCITIDLSVSRYTRISKNENTKVEKELSVRSENPKDSRNIKN